MEQEDNRNKKSYHDISIQIQITINKSNDIKKFSEEGLGNKFLYIFLGFGIFCILFYDIFFNFLLKMNMSNMLNIKSFLIIAFSWSAFLAYYAFEIHTNKDSIEKSYKSLEHNSKRIHQFLFNFFGAIVGWIIIYLFVFTNVLTSFSGLEKIILYSISFLSITGYLPYIAVKTGGMFK